nr:DUF3419 family protein [uncultured Carboxylicivirga sp.]
MNPLFDFGLSQEDVESEEKALKLKNGDYLLSITSAGDVALNLLARNSVKIKCIDINENQNQLLKLKIKALQYLEPAEAAGFLGFIPQQKDVRLKYYNKLSTSFTTHESEFWERNRLAIEKGVINAGRFEQYMARFNTIGLAIVGKKKIQGLLELDDVKDQYSYFDKKLNTKRLNKLFQIIFHPRIYKGNAIAEQGFMNSGKNNIAEFFFQRFRDFCCSTLAYKNYFLQYTFFGKVLFKDALPDYLTEAGVKNIKRNLPELSIETIAIKQFLEKSQPRDFNKFHLSNISDWVNKEEFDDLMKLVFQVSANNGRISSRFIHYLHTMPYEISEHVIPDRFLGNEIIKTDRYPFYNIIPYVIKK